MPLSALKRYIQERRQATLADVALHFDLPADVARQMLDIWVKKGVLSKTRATASCGSSCSHCDPASTEIYIWGEDISIDKPPHCSA